MNRGALRTLTRRYLAETIPAESFWDDPTLNDFIDRSHEEVVSRAELLHCTSEGGVVFVSGEVHGEYLFPKDTLRVVRMFYALEADKKYKRVADSSLEELDLHDPEWTEKVAASGERPRKWAPRGQGFHLYPAPGETFSKALRMWCIQTPMPLADDAAEPDIALAYHESISIAAAIRALKSDRTSSENANTITRLERDLIAGIAWAGAQHARKGPKVQQLRDVRDNYATTSGWRV